MSGIQILKNFETKNSRYRDAKRADKISIIRRPLHCEVNPRRLHDEGELDVVELGLTLITPEWSCIYLYMTHQNSLEASSDLTGNSP